MGGSARTWRGVLPANIIEGSTLLIDLTMSKFEAPDVTIAYEVRVEDDEAIFTDNFETGDASGWGLEVP